MKRKTAVRTIILCILVTLWLPTMLCLASGDPYWYFVKYQPDLNVALQELRQREFDAGRYNPVIPFVSELLPIGPDSPAPGAQHGSIQEALIASEADGTRSILDLDHVSAIPSYNAAAPLNGAVLLKLYGTKKPTREMIERNMDFFERVERGTGIYIIVFKDSKPDQIFFAGRSFD
jgi:hypothetical protein